ncbi:hypothetical protein ACWDTI_21530 [Gordonia sp. NPDC003424]
MNRLRAVIAVTAITLAACSTGSDEGNLDDNFSGPDGVIASEKSRTAPDSPWLITSGTLYRDENVGWTGTPDDGRSPGGTGSAVFRMVSKERGFGDVAVTMRLRIDELVETARTPEQDYDGAHVWLRYQSDRELYAVSVDRRDGVLVIKKKCPGGDENGGTYFDLANEVHGAPIPFKKWQDVSATVRNLPDGSVEIIARRDGYTLRATDTGMGCAPIRAAGGIGLRGDNANIRFDDIKVRPLS